MQSSAVKYGFLDRLLHRVALQLSPVAEMSFDLDQKTVAAGTSDIIRKQHVFVAGLARAGTTILMRRFYASGEFSSLTYRNMPFVLAPNLWRKLTGVSKKYVEAAERAHGDRILVDIDSPESLDEAFWRIFDGRAYISNTHLKPHEPDKETIEKYISYVNAILQANDAPNARYLSKNNNNILRLKCIRRAFPEAVILVPFREPLAHASSMLRQHRSFIKMQEKDGFVRSYMTWLAHHEFGLDHRPFRFEEGGAWRLAQYRSDAIDYWLELWCQTYGWLEGNAPSDAIFVSYEDLCGNLDVWCHLAEISGIDPGSGDEEVFVLSETAAAGPVNEDLAKAASALYKKLTRRASVSSRNSNVGDLPPDSPSFGERARR